MAATVTVEEYLASQDDLLQEAALALPHQFSQCTYPLGPLRQAVYLCNTCPEQRGLCSACSIACHTKHDQIELFPKRGFRCDCPTSSIVHQCTLHTKVEDENKSNTYGQNFLGKFCRCGRPYDAKTELETMIQCLACEDWFHESCCNLRERPTDDPQILIPESDAEPTDDSVSDTLSSGLPPPLISGSDYEAFVCGACVRKIDTLKRWAGSSGIMMAVRDTPTDKWRCIGGVGLGSESDHPVDVEEPSGSTKTGSKRLRSASPDETGATKRARGSFVVIAPTPSQCLAPPPSTLAQTILAGDLTSDSSSLGTGDVFLTDGFRERWCRCPCCQPSLEANSYLLEEEETYEPPDDPDSALSLEELGMRALERIPRERAIDGIHAFNEMRDDLMKYLRPFAQEGKVVNEADVQEFFASLKEAAAAKARR